MLGAPATDALVGARLDATSLALVGLLAGWTAFVAGGGEGRSTPVVLLLLALTGAVVAGRRLARWTGLVPKAVAAAITSTFVLTYPGLLGAGGAPTGYANANATLAAIGFVAAVASARRSPAGTERQVWTAAAAALGSAALLTRSTAGVAILVAVGALWLVAARVAWAPLVAAGGAIVASLALAVTVGTAVDGSAPLADTDHVRVELWSAAADLAKERSVTGLGAGAFEERNPVTDDADLRWVHHEYLELAVELGAVGLLLGIALGLSVLARLAIAGGAGTAAAAAVAIVALHGSVDHVWHVPALLLVVALLVGDGTGGRSEAPAGRTLSVAGEPTKRVHRAIAGDEAQA